MICPECGSEIPDSSKFCMECGTSLLDAGRKRGAGAGRDYASAEETAGEETGGNGDAPSGGGHSSGNGNGHNGDAVIPRPNSPICSYDEWAPVLPVSAGGDLVFKPLPKEADVSISYLHSQIRGSARGGGKIVDRWSLGHRDSNLQGLVCQNSDRPNTDRQDSPGNCEQHADVLPGEIVGPEVLDASRPNKRSRMPFAAAGVVVAIVAIAVVVSIVSALNAPFEISKITFPDEGLRNALLALDDDGDGMIRRDQIPEITDLEVDRAVNISGLSFLTSLESIEAYGDQLLTMDVTDVPSLKSVTVCNSGINKLDVAGLSNLESIDAHNSHLASLDTTGLNSLASLNLESTSLGQLDVSACSQLSSLQVGDSVVVDGIDATTLMENWTVSSFSSGASSSGGDVYLSTESAYDDEGRLSEIVYSSSAGDGTYSYSYDDQGRLVAVDQFPATGDKTRSGDAFKLVYGENGALTTSENSTTGETCTYLYDNQGRFAGFEAFIANENGRRGTSVYSRAYGYDDNGNLNAISGDDAAIISYDENGRIASYATDDGLYAYGFEYDESGRVVQARIVLEGGGCTEQFSYDENGNMVNATRTLDENTRRSFPLGAVTQTNFTYDIHGNLTGMTMVDGEDQVGWCSFQYKRNFSTTGNRPLGSSPTLTDPLWMCKLDSSNPDAIWAPWLFSRMSDQSTDALTMAFYPNEMWVGTNDPLTRR